MPEKTGWRMRAKHRPKDVKFGNDDVPATEQLGRPSSSWQKSRPNTPTISVTDDSRNDAASEASTPRRQARPKLSRYLSGLHTKDHLKHVNLTEEWWNDVDLFQKEPPLSPSAALQSAYSHMLQLPSKPIPVSYFNGLFSLFEDYRKIRAEKEKLGGELHEASKLHEKSVYEWAEAESQYQIEIRRLELLIAHGTSGMAGLAKARMDSVVKRKRVRQRTTSSQKSATTFQDLPRARPNEQMKTKSKQMLLRRPSSPSSHMAALSRQLSASGFIEDPPFGTPPIQEYNITLSRKVKSELNMANMRAAENPGSSHSHSVESGFSWAGDSLPDEINYRPAYFYSGKSHDVFLALQELGCRVARKRGIDSNSFVNGLMCLLEDTDNPSRKSDQGRVTERNGVDGSNIEAPTNPSRPLRQVRSQPMLGSSQKRRRHFSFEPGDDTTYRKMQMELSPEPSPNTQSETSAADNDARKPSKIPIPSPVQNTSFGSVRRESSISSLQSASSKQRQDKNYRNSKSSVLTAFRESSSGSLRPKTSGSVRTAIRAYERSRSDNDPR